MPTYAQIAVKAQERAGLPASSRLRLQSFIDEALKRLADKVASDPMRRQSLMTPPTTSVALTDGEADLTTLITTAPFINVKYIRSGLVYLDDALCQWKTDNNQFDDAIDDLFTTIYLEGNAIKTKDAELNGTLYLKVPFIPTIANLSESLTDDLIDKILELAAMSDAAEDGSK